MLNVHAHSRTRDANINIHIGVGARSKAWLRSMARRIPFGDGKLFAKCPLILLLGDVAIRHLVSSVLIGCHRRCN